MVKKIIGILCVILSLSCFSVSALAVLEKPVPILGPLVGYEPGNEEDEVPEDDLGDEFTDLGGESSTPPADESSSSSEGEEDPFDFGSSSADGSTSSSSSEESVINPDDDEGGTKPNGSATGSAMTSFMKKLEAVSTSEMFMSQYKFASTDMTDPATCYLNFPNDASFIVTESKGTGVIKVETEIVINSSVTEDAIDMVYGKEALLQVIYEAISQAQGRDVGVGADEFKRLVNGQKLLTMPTPATFEGVKTSLKEGIIDTEKFTIEVKGVSVMEFGVTAQLAMTLKETTATGVGGGEDTSSSSSEPAIAPGTGIGKLSPSAGNR